MNLSPLPLQKFFDNAGNPLNGGLLFTYTAGTTTKIATYQDQAGTPNTNPVVLNFRGEANVWLDQTLTYKFVLAPSTDTDPPTNPIWSVDNISAGITFASLTAQIIGQILYARTAAEISANVTPVNYAYPPGWYPRYGGLPSASATTNNAALTSMLAVSASHRAYVPSGIYQVTAPQTVPDFATIDCDKNANFYYTDSISTGAFFLTSGVANTRGGFLQVYNLSIILRTGTACGIRLRNSIRSVFNNTYIEGFIPADWQSTSVTINARTSQGVRIESDPATDCFFNTFYTLQLNHVHFGVVCPSGGIATRQTFKDVMMFGDSIYGDTTSSGFDVAGCQDSIVDGAYMDAYGDTGTNAAFNFSGSSSARWRIRNSVFDAEPGAATVGTIVLGVTVPMRAIRFSSTGGSPSEIEILGSFFSSGCSVVDLPASNGNFVESNPNIGQTWTATLVPLTSGTITLTAGVGGDTCFCEKRGKSIRVWGTLTVASVAAPVGRLQVQGLPFTISNSNSNYAVDTLYASGLAAGATTAVMGFGNRNSATMEFSRYTAGGPADLAGLVQAGTQIMFSCSYIAA